MAAGVQIFGAFVGVIGGLEEKNKILGVAVGVGMWKLGPYFEISMREIFGMDIMGYMIMLGILHFIIF